VHAGDLSLPAGSTLAVDAELLVLHVIAAPTAEQMEAGLGIEAEEGAVAAEGEPAPVPDAPGAAADATS
jgi:large subunit ribosomal protein L25